MTFEGGFGVCYMWYQRALSEARLEMPRWNLEAGLMGLRTTHLMRDENDGCREERQENQDEEPAVHHE